MELPEDKIREYNRRILLARMRLLSKNGFYGLLLMHMSFALDMNCETAATDGNKIIFGPSFLDDLYDDELEFIMMHEILHVVLQHCFRTGQRDDMLFNIACDIVVNSNILYSNRGDLSSITLHKYGESMHLAPDSQEGYNYTAEQVYEMLLQKHPDSGKSPLTSPGFLDDHTKWGSDQPDYIADQWIKRLLDAGKAISIREGNDKRGRMPLCAQRIINELTKARTDWRSVLNDFVQEEITDYSFMPPDRRFMETPFFMPDYNEKEEHPEDILFMIDSSGSMSDDEITAAFSEVKGAIDQFGGKLKGWLGFFDAAVVAPRAFEDVDTLKRIHPKGGGGTSFECIFKYVEHNMSDKLPSCIIILTDGYAPFPPERVAMGIPVLWLIDNDDITPPWGKIGRFF